MNRQVTKTVQWADLKSLVDEALNQIMDFHIAFIKITRTKIEEKVLEEDAALLGSGTLVAAGKRRGILTAEHVLRELPNTGPLGLLVKRNRGVHRFVIDVDTAAKVPIARGTCDAEGPDLGLLLLPEHDVHRLEAFGKAFYNLTQRRDRMLNSPPDRELGVWLLCGTPGEFVTDGQPGRFEHVKEFSSVGAMGKLAGQREADRFDYLRFEVNYGGKYEGPVSYGGLSGGSLWHLLGEERHEKWQLKEFLLRGVPFYQHELINAQRKIECHGTRSVYEAAASRLAGESA